MKFDFAKVEQDQEEQDLENLALRYGALQDRLNELDDGGESTPASTNAADAIVAN